MTSGLKSTERNKAKVEIGKTANNFCEYFLPIIVGYFYLRKIESPTVVGVVYAGSDRVIEAVLLYINVTSSCSISSGLLEAHKGKGVS